MAGTASDETGVLLRWSFARNVDEVWAGLTGPRLLAQWIGQPVEAKVVSGGWLTIDHGERAVSCSHLIEVQRPHLLDMTWEFPQEPTSRIRIDLTAQDGATTIVQLAHLDLGALTVDYRIGWMTHFTYLEAAVEG